jgi:hypothetical protein
MPIGHSFYSRPGLNLNLRPATGVSAQARQGTELDYNPGARRELTLSARPGE